MRTLYLDEGDQSLVVLDQTRLPQEIAYLHLKDAGAVADAIRRLCVRGAPAIGVAAAIGLYACANAALGSEDFFARVQEDAAIIERARPTAVNLSWAVQRMMKAAEGSDPGAYVATLKREALAMFEEDRERNRAIGRFGAALIRDGDGVLTHCNAGKLAAVDHGTALAPFYEAAAQGKQIHILADETRPLLQGARLTAFELMEEGLAWM